jgi:hypothetical protein
VRVIEVSGQSGGQQNQVEHDDAIGPGADSDEHHLASRLRDTLAARHARQAAHAEDERLADAQVTHAARKTGGKQAVTFMSSLLDDGWTMIRGYQNSSGGIGQLLLGTHGLVAMTSLHLDATVHCRGDKWHAEKSDHRDGRPLGETQLVDQAGRSPSTQLNQAADALEQFLRSCDVEISVARVVLLTHPRSRVEESRRPAVQLFASPYDLARWLKELPKVLDRGQRRKIEELISGHASH